MSAKSEHNSETEASIRTVSDLPQVDNSDFDTSTEENQVSQPVFEAEPSLDRISIFSIGSSPSQTAENQTEVKEVKNVSVECSSHNEESQSIEMEKPPSTPTAEEQFVDPNSMTITSSSNLDSVRKAESISVKMDSSNSLYDSNEKLVFSRSTSEYCEIVGEQSAFWKNLLLVSMLPYAAVGVPVGSIFQLSQQQHPVSTSKQWLKFLFSTPVAIGLNLAELLMVIMLNVYVTYLFVGPLYALVGHGQMSERLIALSVHLYEVIPLLMGLNLVWPKGYSVSNIVRVLDTKMSFKEKEPKTKLYLGLSKMASSYVCLVVLTIGSMISFEWKSANFYMTELRSDFYYHLVTRFFLMLIVPVYLTIISGVHRRIYCLNTYIRSMTEDIASISLMDLQRVKNIFKQNADVVCSVNSVFNLLVSDILIIVLINVLKDLFQVFMLVASLDSFSISLEKGSRQIDPKLLSTATKWIIIDLGVVLSKCILLGLTVSKVKDTNKEIKQILSHLHDLASNFVEKPSEIYQSFCLVKYYIKTRNERSDKPAILRLYAVKWIPCLSLR